MCTKSLAFCKLFKAKNKKVIFPPNCAKYFFGCVLGYIGSVESESGFGKSHQFKKSYQTPDLAPIEGFGWLIKAIR